MSVAAVLFFCDAGMRVRVVCGLVSLYMHAVAGGFYPCPAFVGLRRGCRKGRAGVVLLVCGAVSWVGGW